MTREIELRAGGTVLDGRGRKAGALGDGGMVCDDVTAGPSKAVDLRLHLQGYVTDEAMLFFVVT